MQLYRNGDTLETLHHLRSGCFTRNYCLDGKRHPGLKRLGRPLHHRAVYKSRRVRAQVPCQVPERQHSNAEVKPASCCPTATCMPGRAACLLGLLAANMLWQVDTAVAVGAALDHAPDLASSYSATSPAVSSAPEIGFQLAAAPQTVVTGESDLMELLKDAVQQGESLPPPLLLEAPPAPAPPQPPQATASILDLLKGSTSAQEQLAPVPEAEKARLQREKEVLAREAREKVQREQQEKEHHDKEQKEKERREKEQREKDKKAKEAAEAERKERERVASEKKRQEAERRKRLETQLIGAGGAVGLGVLGFTKWQTILTVGAVLFRSVGGPSLVSGILRTPGYIFGRSVRAVEWDVAASPTMPNGCSHSFKLRAFTPVGMRIAIAKANRLSGPGEVKQISQWIQIGPNFYEPLRSVASLAMLPDPAWVVWSRQPRTGEHGIPRRGDEHKLSMAGRGLLEGMSKDEEITLMLRAISGAAALTRQRGRLVAPSSNPPAGSDSSARIGNIGSNSTTPATASVKVVASSSGERSAHAAAPVNAHNVTACPRDAGSAECASPDAEDDCCMSGYSSDESCLTDAPDGDGSKASGSDPEPSGRSSSSSSNGGKSGQELADGGSSGANNISSSSDTSTSCQDLEEDRRLSSNSSSSSLNVPSTSSMAAEIPSTPSQTLPALSIRRMWRTFWRPLRALSRSGEFNRPPNEASQRSSERGRDSNGAGDDQQARRAASLTTSHGRERQPSAHCKASGGRRSSGRHMRSSSSSSSSLHDDTAVDVAEEDYSSAQRQQRPKQVKPLGRVRRGRFQRSVSFGDELPPDKGYRGATHSLDRLLRHLSLPANFEPISEEEEQALVLAGCSETNSALLALFQAYATKDLATFLTYARAHMASQARS